MKLFENTQSGRSMVEMLGVLAIIGVLSVGGIAGYSKAMYKHKMSKTMDILSYAVARVVELDAMNLGGYIYTAQDAIDYGIMPDCDVNYVDSDGNTGESCPLPVGEFSFMFRPNHVMSGGNMHGQFSIDFKQNPATSCVEFFNSGIYKNVPEDWYKYHGYIGIDAVGVTSIYVYSKSEVFIGDEGAKPVLTSGDIADACGTCADAESCRIWWVVRLETEL